MRPTTRHRVLVNRIRVSSSVAGEFEIRCGAPSRGWPAPTRVYSLGQCRVVIPPEYSSRTYGMSPELRISGRTVSLNLF